MRSKIFTGLLFLTTVFVSSCSLLNSEDGGDKGDGGFHVECEPTVTARVKWTFSKGSAAGGPAVGMNGTVVLSDSTNLYAIDGTNGMLKWTSEVGSIMFQPAVGSDGKVYANKLKTGSFSMELFALSADTGGEKWKVESDDMFLSPPVLFGDDKVLFPGIENLYALSVEDGSEMWRYGYGTGSGERIAVPGKDGRLFLVKDGKIVKLDGNGGEEAVFELPATALFAAVGEDGRVFVPCKDRKIYAISPDDGSIFWGHDMRGEPDAVKAAPGGLVYIAYSDLKYLEALDQNNGEKRWSYVGEGKVAAPAVGEDGTAYLPVVGAAMVALDPSSGDIRWSYKPSSDMETFWPPAIGPGKTILLPSSDLLTALDPSDDAVLPDKLSCNPCTLACGEGNSIFMCQPDGSGEESVHECLAGQGCSNANCYECQTHEGTVCFGGNVWWTNSCGTREDLKETCTTKTGYTCSSGICSKDQSCTMSCSADDDSISSGLSCGSSSRECHNSYDSHGRLSYMSCTYSNGKMYSCSINYDSLGQPHGSCNGEGDTCYF